MRKTEILDKLRKHKPELQQRFSVESLALFGSHARGEETKDSDIDILVEFNAPVGIEFIDLLIELESILNKPVDLVIKKNIYPKVRPYIERDMISI
jgi:hypothetical protein